MHFDDDFFLKLDTEELAAIFHEAKTHDTAILNSGACSALSPDEAKLMSASLAIAAALLRRYHAAQGQPD